MPSTTTYTEAYVCFMSNLRKTVDALHRAMDNLDPEAWKEGPEKYTTDQLHRAQSYLDLAYAQAIDKQRAITRKSS